MMRGPAQLIVIGAVLGCGSGKLDPFEAQKPVLPQLVESCSSVDKDESKDLSPPADITASTGVATMRPSASRISMRTLASAGSV